MCVSWCGLVCVPSCVLVGMCGQRCALIVARCTCACACMSARESSLQDPIIVTYHDASWATRRDVSSQGGQLTVLMEGRVLKRHQGKLSVLNWTSRRSKRVAA